MDNSNIRMTYPKEILNGTTEPGTINAISQYWTQRSIVFESINITMIAITLWLLTSIIIFTTKTGRWRTRAGCSSFTSGKIPILCVCAITSALLKYVTTEMLFMIPRIRNGTYYCEVVADVDFIIASICLYFGYLFFWYSQTLIYQHPYVKHRIKKWPKIVGLICLTLVSINSIATAVIFVYPDSFTSLDSRGCYLKQTQNHGIIKGNLKNVYMAISLAVAQIVLVVLCVYPSFNIRLQPVEQVPAENEGPRTIQRKSRTSTTSTSFAEFRNHLKVAASRKAQAFISPIQTAVKRTALSSVIAATGLIIGFAGTGLGIPRTAPVPVRQTVYNIGLLMGVLALPVNFGVWNQLLQAMCGLCRRTTVQSKSGNSSERSAVTVINEQSQVQ